MAELKRAKSVYHFIVKTFLVAAVLLLVAVVIFPFFAKARECAECGPTCASNLKQLGLGFLQYVQDYDGKWPGGADHWAGAIFPYEKSTGVYLCPEDPDKTTSISYAMNDNVRGRPQSNLLAPELTVLATDFCGSPATSLAGNDYASGQAHSPPERASQYTLGALPNTAWGGVRLGTTADTPSPPRHDNGDIYLACDAHVQFLRPQQVSSGIDNTSSTGQQASIHAAGTGTVGPGKRWSLTFSER